MIYLFPLIFFSKNCLWNFFTIDAIIYDFADICPPPDFLKSGGGQ